MSNWPDHVEFDLEKTNKKRSMGGWEASTSSRKRKIQVGKYV